MMRGTEFAELAAFVAIADRSSFVKAAAALGVSTSSLSQTLRALEERLGVRLLNRTTRSVSLTEAGERLLGQVRPALEELGAAVEAINRFRDKPAGTLRLTSGSVAAKLLVMPLLGRFLAEYPEITLDIQVEDELVDIVSGRFDAGIRGGKWLERDMIAVRIGPESRVLAVASPRYLEGRTAPSSPQELHDHNCIRIVWAGGPARWEFARGEEKIEISVEGSLVTNDVDILLRGALDGVGIAYMLEFYVAEHLAAGRLVPLLEEWAPSYAGYHIFYPSRRQMPAPLKAFIDFMRRTLPEG
jgi:DNA-binding transcriptional LysR family regulator